MSDNPLDEFSREEIKADTDAQLDAYYTSWLPRLSACLKEGVANQDTETLRKLARAIAPHQAQLSKWTDACGKTASPRLLAIVEALGAMRDDINAALAGELPGQRLEGDEWKDEGDSQT